MLSFKIGLGSFLGLGLDIGASTSTSTSTSTSASASARMGRGAGDEYLLLGVVVLLFLGLGGGVLGQVPNEFNAQSSIGGATSNLSNNDRPILVFTDVNTGQLYGRFATTETVPVVEYAQEQVTEKVWVPTWVTETMTTTQTQYIPTYTYQAQVRNVSAWNPFAPPRQVLEYVAVPQYTPKYVQVAQPITHPKYEEREIVRVIPKLVRTSAQRPTTVDRPIDAQQAAAYAASNNPYQPAILSAANPNVPRYQTRPIGYAPNGYANMVGPSYGAAPIVAQAPPPYYPARNYPGQSPLQPPLNQYPGYQPQLAISPRTVPLVPLNPTPGPTGNMYVQSQPNYPPPNPYGVSPYAPSAYTAAYTPNGAWSKLLSGTGSLFQGGLFRNNRNYTTVASNTAPGQPYWFNPQPSVTGASSPSGFRPSTSPFANNSNEATSSFAAPISPYRDPIQAGMPATELR